MSHELRTPLSTIKTASEVALLDPDLSRDTRKTFQEITEELTRVSEILDNLLSLNSLSGQEGMRFQNLDVGAVVTEVVHKLQPLARERHVPVRLKTEVGSIAIGNRSALEQVAHHLIKNALSFTPAESGPVQVRVYPEGSETIIEVEDHGIGMSPEELTHIFEPFYRADTSRNRTVRHGGSGLGLTIVDEMVRKHGGTVTIESKRRMGTTVVVRIPRGGFIPHSGTPSYDRGRSNGNQQQKDGAHEPHRGRRNFTEVRVVTKGVAGA